MARSAEDIHKKIRREIGKILVENVRWFVIGVMIVIAAPFLLYAQFGLDKHSLWYDVFRDVGIAFLISALVSIIFETYARLRFETELMSDVSGIVISDLSREDIWQQVKEQVLEKTAIRENFHTKMKLYRDKRLSAGQMVLWMETRYELRGLRSVPAKIRITHFNDRHLKVEQAKLPCFEFICIGEKERAIEKYVTDGKFEEEIEVEAKTGNSIGVLLRRKEIVYIPGITYLTMTEMTKGIKLDLENIPDNLEAIFSIRPHFADIPLKANSAKETRFDDVSLLPGQGIEFLFKRKGD